MARTPEQHREYQRRYCERHAEELRQRRIAYRATPEYQEYVRRYRLENREAILKTQKAWRERNPERARQTKRAWRERNKEHYRETCRQWYAENKDIAHGYYIKRSRAHGKGYVDPDQWRQVIEFYRSCCVYCGRYCERPHMDHVIPLSRGGKHDISNVVPACQSCNSSKHNKTLAEWRHGLYDMNSPNWEWWLIDENSDYRHRCTDSDPEGLSWRDVSSGGRSASQVQA